MLLTCHSWPRHPSPEVLVKSSSRHLRSVISTVGLTTTIALTLTACGPASTSSTTPNAGTSPGSLVVGITTDPDTLFPWKATQFQAVNIAQNLYGTLTEFDRDLNVVPGLAQSWDTSADGKTITFHLRTGATFASGAPLHGACRAEPARRGHRDHGDRRTHRHADPVGTGRRAARKPRKHQHGDSATRSDRTVHQHKAGGHGSLPPQRPQAEPVNHARGEPHALEWRTKVDQG